jgi:dual specificity protein kinase YAK1
MDQWQGYSDATGGSQRRYNGSSQRDYGQQNSQTQQSPSGLRYDQYGNMAQNSATSPMSTPQLRDNNGDVPMSDAHDAYGAMKYPMRPHHQSHLSGGRPTMNLHSEPSAAAQRYSPMEVLSPTSPYPPKSASGQFSPHRQSPTRASSDYPSSPYYAGRQGSQLPTITAYGNNGQDSQPNSAAPFDGAANDIKSPRRAYQPEKRPVPEFRKLRAITDLRPTVNAQPAFRRADPEGGFISVGAKLRSSRYRTSNSL